MENPPNQIPKPANKTLWTALAIVILIVAGYGVYAYTVRKDNDNTNNSRNTTANANLNINAITNQTINTNTATNTTIDTSDWKTYTNSEFGFTVKTPESWNVTQTSVSRDSFKYESFGINPGTGKGAGYQINVYASLKDLYNGGNYTTLAEWIASQETGPYSYPTTDFLGQGTYEGYWPSADKTYSFFIEHDARVYNIDMSWITPEIRETNPTTKRPIFNPEEQAFLKSFKLL